MDKYDKLKECLKSLGSVAVAFSGGVDSAFLLKAAADALGDKAFAVTVNSALFPESELSEAKEFCEKNNIKLIVFEIDELETEGFAENPKNRCYLCKRRLFVEMKKIAEENGAQYVAEGSNVDDEGDYRPGLVAVKELGIKSPLRSVGFTKAEIREKSKELNLPTWDKPSFACLASRFVYGERITKEKLKRVEKAEDFLRGLGMRQLRVRVHGDMARIEVLPEDFGKIIEKRIEIDGELKRLGFLYVSLDLLGYRTGSMNATSVD